MKKKFFVELVKTVQYHVEAEDMDEAENIAIELDGDKDAEVRWATDPYEEIRVEEE
jgi:hypothetical protein